MSKENIFSEDICVISKIFDEENIRVIMSEGNGGYGFQLSKSQQKITIHLRKKGGRKKISKQISWSWYGYGP